MSRATEIFEKLCCSISTLPYILSRIHTHSPSAQDEICRPENLYLLRRGHTPTRARRRWGSILCSSFWFTHAAFSSMVHLVVLDWTAINTTPPPRTTSTGICGNCLISLISLKGGQKSAHLSGRIRVLAPSVRPSCSWTTDHTT